MAQLEQQLGAPLPEDYREFLLLHNGGIPDNPYFSCGRDPEWNHLWIDYFVEIDSRLARPDPHPPTGTLAFWNGLLSAVMPREAMMIATVCRDHRLLLFLQGPRRNQVHLVNWDEESLSLDEILKAMKLVAPTFAEFYSGLYSDPDEELGGH